MSEMGWPSALQKLILSWACNLLKKVRNGSYNLYKKLGYINKRVCGLDREAGEPHTDNGESSCHFWREHFATVKPYALWTVPPRFNVGSVLLLGRLFMASLSSIHHAIARLQAVSVSPLPPELVCVGPLRCSLERKLQAHTHFKKPLPTSASMHSALRSKLLIFATTAGQDAATSTCEI